LPATKGNADSNEIAVDHGNATVISEILEFFFLEKTPAEH
jgi:hypothetical protein